MISNVAFERSFAELSNGHEFSIVKALSSAKKKAKCFRPTDRPTDRVGHRVACTQLKKIVETKERQNVNFVVSAKSQIASVLILKRDWSNCQVVTCMLNKRRA